jgi:hypothetical protein
MLRTNKDTDLLQVTCEDWEAPGRILEVMEAVSNFTAVWRALWLNDPTPQVLWKLLIHVNFGARVADDEKSQVR